MSDRRRETRNACYLRASILIDDGARRVEAEAHDISNNGMLLYVLDSREVPDRFIVSIPRRHMIEHVKVMRRSRKELGVVFRRPGE
jgi:hypothetical protein